MTISRGRIMQLITPALEVLNSITLDIQGHPYCPLNPAAEVGINSLRQLLQEAKDEEENHVVKS